MRPIKPNRPYDAPEYALQLAPRLALVVESAPAPQDRLLQSFLFYGACGLPQCDREEIEGHGRLVGHA